FLIEAAHEQHPLDRLSTAANPERAVSPGSYRQNFKVELRSGAGVDTELVEAGRVPPLKRGKIEKWVLHRPLHFVGKGAGEEHARGVGVDALYRLRRRVIGLGLGKKIKDVGLVPYDLRTLQPPPHSVTMSRLFLTRIGT